MACLTVNILGEPRVLDGDQKEVAIPSKKTMALLAYLTIAPGNAQPREELVSLLWGDRFDQQGRQSLRQALYAVRKVMGDDCAQALLMDGELISLCRDRTRSDVWEFERLAASEAEEDLIAAAKMFRGRLLAGIALRDENFEEWLASERQRLKDLLWRTLYRIAKHQKRNRAFSDALDTTRRLLELNPLREKSHRLIMRIHAQSGDRAAALAQYHHCVELLRRELQLEPDLMTLRLYEELKATVPEDDEDDDDREVKEDRPAETPAASPTATGDDQFFARDRPAVVVLAFEQLGGSEDQAYFARGITSDITNALSYWRWFPVIGQSSATIAGQDGKSISEIAQGLEARYAVTGSVRLSSDRVRIAVQLIDARSGHHLWAHRYDNPLGDLFDVQDEITEQIVSAIEPEVLRAEHNRALRKRPADMTAWDYVMRADASKNALGSRAVADAINHLNMAIAIDPDLSIAWSQLAHCHWYEGVLGWADDVEEAFGQSEQAARQALALDESDWLAHTMLGMCDMWNRHDYDLSLSRLNRALQLNPSASVAHHSAACSLEFAGQPEDAIPHIMTVMRLDPNYANNASLFSDLSLSYLQLEQFDDAALYARKSASLKPDYSRVYHRLASALGHLGKRDEARAALDSIFRLHPGFSAEYVRSTYPFKDPRHLDILLDGLLKAGLGD